MWKNKSFCRIGKQNSVAWNDVIAKKIVNQLFQNL